eukprot:c27590_g1_i1 orf=513-1673(-)
MSDAVVNGLAGAGGGIVAQLLTYPLQTVNTRQQTDRKAKSSALQASNSTSKLHEQSKQINSVNTVQEMCKVLKEEGWGGLYRGLTPSLVGTAASQGVYYYFYQVFRNRAEAVALERKIAGAGDGMVGMFSSLVIAALAGCLNVILTNPIWVIVTRMQTHSQVQSSGRRQAHGKEDIDIECAKKSDDLGCNSKNDKDNRISIAEDLASLAPVQVYGTSLAVQELFNEAGLMGFWKGVLPTLIMVSNPSIQFMLYESMLKQLRSNRIRKQLGLTDIMATEVFLLGAVAKLGATVATYPLLVVKSRLQAKQVIGGDKALHYTGTIDAIVKMMRSEGLAGFYKGMGTKIVQSVFAAAVLFMIKEELVKVVRAAVTKNGKSARNSKIKLPK